MAMLKILIEEKGIISQFIAGVRNAKLQGDRHKMRRYIRKCAEIIGFELSKVLNYSEQTVETPLGLAKCMLLSDKVVVASILRAGLPMHEGMLDVFEDAESSFIGAYRKHHRDGTFEIASEYQSSANLEGKVLIIVDPMLATGSSLKLTLENLIEEYGQPSSIHVVSLIAAKAGYNHLHRFFPEIHYWIGALDEELTAKNYIVPGLGDAGDICFGEKC